MDLIYTVYPPPPGFLGMSDGDAGRT